MRAERKMVVTEETKFAESNCPGKKGEYTKLNIPL